VQPAAVENKNIKMEEVGKRELPGRHSLPIIVSHKPINLVTPALSLGRAFSHLRHQRFVAEIGMQYLFHIAVYLISEIEVSGSEGGEGLGNAGQASLCGESSQKFSS